MLPFSCYLAVSGFNQRRCISYSALAMAPTSVHRMKGARNRVVGLTNNDLQQQSCRTILRKCSEHCADLLEVKYTSDIANDLREDASLIHDVIRFHEAVAPRRPGH